VNFPAERVLGSEILHAIELYLSKGFGRFGFCLAFAGLSVPALEFFYPCNIIVLSLHKVRLLFCLVGGIPKAKSHIPATKAADLFTGWEPPTGTRITPILGNCDMMRT
jgi:hypothetical protein